MSIYHDLILDHYRNPRHHGELDGATNHSERHNPTCGDALTMDLLVKNGTIADIRFRGNGCAISQASASLLSEHIVGKPVAQAQALGKDAVLALLGVSLSPTRLKCALLALETLQAALLPNAPEK
jgi:nitrogen fixation NifU-like protein